MPCRLQPYIWISDDILANAYFRFARTCQHSQKHTRRHGSNVPGPLEARRRLARRRMAALSIAPAPSLLPDFGSLFGTGGIDVGSLWSPPASVHPGQPPPNAPSIPTSASSLPHSVSAPELDPFYISTIDTPNTVDEYLDLLGSCSHVQSVKQSHATLHSDGHLPVNFSKAAFSCLLESAASDQLIDFLQGDLNHPQAHNTHAYLRHLFRSDLDIAALSAYMTLACDKIALGTIHDSELVAIIQELIRTPKSGASLPDREASLIHAANLLRSSLQLAYPSTTPPEAIVSALFDLLCSLPPKSTVVHDMFHVYAWLPQTAHYSATQSLAEYLYYQIRRETRRQTRNPSQSLGLDPFIQALPSQYASKIISAATVQFLAYMRNMQASEKIADSEVSAERLLCWLHCLRQHVPNVLTPLTSSAKAIYSAIASQYPPADISHHMAALPSLDAANILFHYWIKPITVGDSPSPRAHTRRLADAASPSEAYGVTYTLQRRPVPSRNAASLRTTATLWKRKSSTLGEQEDPHSTAPFVSLFSHLCGQKMDYSHWLDQTFRIMAVKESPVAVHNFYKSLVSEKVIIPYAVATGLIHYLIDSKKPARAYSVLNRPGATQWLSSMPELMFTMIDNYPVKSEFLFRLLNRPEYSNSLPSSMRNKLNNPLTTERVNLIQHMAYAMARSPHLTSTMAFRRVKDCLLYLVDHGAPISTLMSRALVHSGLTRPLREGAWLSKDKCTWILGYVRKLEGEDVAQMIDEAAWGLRNKNAVIKNAHMNKFTRLDMEAQAEAWEFRKKFGHASHRWKRTSRPFKPWAS